MKRTTKILGVVMILIMMAGLTACSGGSDGEGIQNEVTWKVGHVRPQGTATDEDVKWFADQVKEKTDGKINIDIYPSSELGDYQAVQERVSMGDVEMQLAPAGTNVDKALGLPLAPYLVKSWDEAEKLYAGDSELRKTVDKLFEEQNIKLLAAYPKYFGGIALGEEPKEPGDPDVNKGIKIRAPGIKSFELTAQALGYNATPIPYAEAFTSFQTGVVNGIIGSGAEGYYSEFRDLVECYLPVRDHFEIWYLYMNKGKWDKLSEEQQEKIQSIANEFETERFKVAEETEQEFRDKLREEGIKVYDFSDEEIDRFAEKIRAEVWPELKDVYGEELFEKVTEDIK